MNAITCSMMIFSYLWGSLSSAIFICRIAHLPDPLTNGSGNPGATNVLRLGSKLAAVCVMIFDILKGVVPVWTSNNLGLSSSCLTLIAITVYLGHVYPVFFHFRGGKGVATAFGAMSFIDYHLSGLMIGTWLFIVLLFGYSSLGAIVCALIIPCYVVIFKPQFTFLVLTFSMFLIFRHYENIQRLLQGKESKIFPLKKQKDINY